MIIILYSIIVFLATIAGALAGLGGGIIIKPLFDIIGVHDTSTISFYSSVAVFAMCIVSIIKQLKNGYAFRFKMLFLISIGSLIGGFIGEKIFNIAILSFSNSVVKVIQAVLLAITLIYILIYTLNKNNIKQYRLNNSVLILASGGFLGSISIFLGIGGGPLNVTLLMILFSFQMRDAIIYSVATIFFSQLAKLWSVFISNKLFEYDLFIVPFICIAAILGGFIGTLINQKLDNAKIEKVYVFLIGILIIISGYNMINAII